MDDVCQNWRRIEANKKIELKSDATTILIHTIIDEGLEEEYKCFTDSPNYYHLRCLLFVDIYIISDIICGNKEHNIWMTLNTPPDWQSTSVYFGLNIDHWNERFHGNNSIY